MLMILWKEGCSTVSSIPSLQLNGITFSHAGAFTSDPKTKDFKVFYFLNKGAYKPVELSYERIKSYQ